MIYRRIDDLIPERLEELERVNKKCSRRKKNVPEGSLRVINNKGSYQYYVRNKHESNGKYIGKKDKDAFRGIVLPLAEKEYIEQVLEAVENEMVLLKELQDLYAENVYEKIYDSMCAGRQCVTAPVALSDEEFVRQWLSQDYEKKAIAEGQQTFRTRNGELTRSKSEQHIANTLFDLGIPYLYEKPYTLIDKYGRAHDVFSDFTILDVRNRKELIWEHFGMMDDPQYCEKAAWKMDLYMRNGFTASDNLIITMETKRNPFDASSIENMLRERFVI